MSSTRQQQHTPESIAPFVTEIRARLPTIGASDMVSSLRTDYNVRVSQYVHSDTIAVNS